MKPITTTTLIFVVAFAAVINAGIIEELLTDGSLLGSPSGTYTG
jgi:hypothetical protein